MDHKTSGKTFREIVSYLLFALFEGNIKLISVPFERFFCLNSSLLCEQTRTRNTNCKWQAPSSSVNISRHQTFREENFDFRLKATKSCDPNGRNRGYKNTVIPASVLTCAVTRSYLLFALFEGNIKLISVPFESFFCLNSSLLWEQTRTRKTNCKWKAPSSSVNSETPNFYKGKFRFIFQTVIILKVQWQRVGV